jgi:hypothetical protein
MLRAKEVDKYFEHGGLEVISSDNGHYQFKG